MSHLELDRKNINRTRKELLCIYRIRYAKSIFFSYLHFPTLLTKSIDVCTSSNFYAKEPIDFSLFFLFPPLAPSFRHVKQSIIGLGQDFNEDNRYYNKLTKVIVGLGKS